MRMIERTVAANWEGMNMTIEQIIKLLKSNKCIENVIYKESSDGNFNRDITFVIRGVTYKIEWWINLSYLHIGEFKMYFDKVELDGCWPNHFKNNLNFLTGGNTTAIIPVEEYDK